MMFDSLPNILSLKNSQTVGHVCTKSHSFTKPNQLAQHGVVEKSENLRSSSTTVAYGSGTVPNQTRYVLQPSRERKAQNCPFPLDTAGQQTSDHEYYGHILNAVAVCMNDRLISHPHHAMIRSTRQTRSMWPQLIIIIRLVFFLSIPHPSHLL